MTVEKFICFEYLMDGYAINWAMTQQNLSLGLSQPGERQIQVLSRKFAHSKSSYTFQ